MAERRPRGSAEGSNWEARSHSQSANGQTTREGSAWGWGENLTILQVSGSTSTLPISKNKHAKWGVQMWILESDPDAQGV